MAKRIPKHEREARDATFAALMDARDQLEDGSVEGIFVDHAANHCFEAWLSESFGYPVRIVCWTGDGVEIERCG
jgi:hypothetical protein